MALFGAPIAHEDHAVRACYAALAMQEAMCHLAEEMRRSQGLELQIQVGLNSGEVVVRTIANDLHMDYSAIGQTTHLAARMEQLAPPRTIRLTAATLRLVEGLVRVNCLGPVPVKGLAEPVEVFELIGASAIRRRLQASTSRGLTRFVGRQTELDALGQALAQAAGGHFHMVALVGEPGVEKSRLVYECIHSHRTRDFAYHAFRGEMWDKALTYFREAGTEELGMRPLIAHCHLGLGSLYAKTGQRQKACAELSAAIELYRAMEMTFWLLQVEVALAQVV
jgi:hypothetical protein